jgi:hypothetical protein
MYKYTKSAIYQLIFEQNIDLVFRQFDGLGLDAVGD